MDTHHAFRKYGNRAHSEWVTHNQWVDEQADKHAYEYWRGNTSGQCGASIETLGTVLDKYEFSDFCHDDTERFLSLVDHLSPRDAEIILCFSVLQMRPTDLSILFGKAGHRAEEDLHKAAHKLAGLIEFGIQPEIAEIDAILTRAQLHRYGDHSLAACIWQYARTRDFRDISRLIGSRGLRQQMLRTFKILHASEDREAELLAGWILWLVDGSDARGKGWRKRQRHGRENKLGPTVFKTMSLTTNQLTPPATGRGGQGQRPDTVKITKRMKFCLRGNG